MKINQNKKKIEQIKARAIAAIWRDMTKNSQHIKVYYRNSKVILKINGDFYAIPKVDCQILRSVHHQKYFHRIPHELALRLISKANHIATIHEGEYIV